MGEKTELLSDDENDRYIVANRFLISGRLGQRELVGPIWQRYMRTLHSSECTYNLLSQSAGSWNKGDERWQMTGEGDASEQQQKLF